MGITRIRITNYRGIEALDSEIPPAGALICGDNGQGKTTVLKAIQAALTAQDIGPDAVRLGADKAEILVDLDSVSVRRAITKKGSQLAVTNADGFKASAPQTFLRDMLGASSLDPIALFTLKPKERRVRILEAMPIKVTIEQVRRWVPKVPDNYDVSGHGLEVIDRIHKKAYEQRTAANAAAKAAKAEAEAAHKTWHDAASNAPSEAPDVAKVEKAFAESNALYAALEARAQEHKRATERSAATMAKIAELRDKAASARAGAVDVSVDEFVKWREIIDRCHARVRELEVELRYAQQNLEDARGALNELESKRNAFACAMSDAAKFEGQAKELESAIAQASVEPVSNEELAEAQEAASFASIAMDAEKADALRFIKAQEAKGIAEAAAKKLADAEAEAARLDGIVKALADAPAQLFQQCDGIPGLSLEGDDVFLDGVAIDSLCGAEKIRLAVEIARRANAKSKILVVDELERLSVKNLEVFVREATRDGWQLLGTRVTDGQVVIEAIGE